MVANLRKLRVNKGISQQQLATALGVTQQSVNKYENHKVEPDIYMLTKMADFFGTTLDYLVGYEKTHQDASYTEQRSLSPEEAAFLDKYRILSPRQKDSIRLILDNYLESK